MHSISRKKYKLISGNGQRMLREADKRIKRLTAWRRSIRSSASYPLTTATPNKNPGLKETWVCCDITIWSGKPSITNLQLPHARLIVTNTIGLRFV